MGPKTFETGEKTVESSWEYKLADVGSVWIGLILLKLKTYYWNHCSKMIFKCVNSVVGPIFNEKIDKKWNLWIRKQCTYVLFTENWSKVAVTVHVPYMNSNRMWGENAWKKNKKIKKGGGKRRNWNATHQTPTQKTNAKDLHSWHWPCAIYHDDLTTYSTQRRLACLFFNLFLQFQFFKWVVAISLGYSCRRSYAAEANFILWP